MESVLSGIPQYIIASINVLITISQSTYIMNLEELIARRIKEIETESPDKNIKRHKTNWHLLLAAWWMLAGMAMVTIILRIIPSMFFDHEAEIHHPWFIFIDFLILLGTFLGYSLLATISFRSWKWNTWWGKAEPK